MTDLIQQIQGIKETAKKAGDLSSPHVGNALSALDAAAFNLANEQKRLAEAERTAKEAKATNR